MSEDFEFSKTDFKNYPHFDAPISIKEIERLVTDPVRVSKHRFYPFIAFKDSWQPYRSIDAGKPDKKTRKIRYGARQDAYVFSFYRKKLSHIYELRLKDLNIQHAPIAYRRIKKKSGSESGKSNIDFAKDAFDSIKLMGNCIAVALDVEGYFDNLDHQKIKSLWCDLINCEELPADHYAIFKNVTRYRFVDQRKLYKRLGFFGDKIKNGYKIQGFLVPFDEIPKKICSNDEFRDKVCGGNPAYGPSIVEKHTKYHGIPQGSPISDLIANFYMIEFDFAAAAYANINGGIYMRYSDDILLILPGDDRVARRAIDFIKAEVKKYGENLVIKDKKTCVAQFKCKNGKLFFENCHIAESKNRKNGFEYLGFRFDGRRVYVKDGTLGRFYAKVSSAAKIEAWRHVYSNPALGCEALIDSFNYSIFSEKFSRVRKGNLTGDFKSLTFLSYLKRASATFGADGQRIERQVRKFDKFMRNKIRVSIRKFSDR